jgi:hypothetical protein
VPFAMWLVVSWMNSEFGRNKDEKFLQGKTFKMEKRNEKETRKKRKKEV